MFSLTKPTAAHINEFIRTQRPLPLTYTEVGATRNLVLPLGYGTNRLRRQLGTGEAVYEHAKTAMREWQMYNLSWTELYPANTPLTEDEIFVAVVRHLGFWSLNPCRIVYTIDEHSDDRQKFGFAIGTLPKHSESGEERFTVEFIRSSQTVWYEIFAFARAYDPLARLGTPFVRLLQKQFARDSFRAMRRAVNDKAKGKRQKDE